MQALFAIHTSIDEYVSVVSAMENRIEYTKITEIIHSRYYTGLVNETDGGEEYKRAIQAKRKATYQFGYYIIKLQTDIISRHSPMRNLK